MEQTTNENRDEILKEYTNAEITVLWKPATCIHSKIYWKGLRSVFAPWKRPWVYMEGAPTERIIAQISQCPSGALSYYWNESPPTVIQVSRGLGSDTSPGQP